MYKILLVITSLSFFTVACSQNKEGNTTEAKAVNKVAETSEEDNSYEINAEVNSSENYEMLIPDGYELLDKAEGDINNDGTSDMVLVVKSQQEKADEMPGEDVPGRILILLTKDSKGLYSRAAESSTAILAKNEGGASSDDPFQGVEAKPGQFSFTHMGGASERWSFEHTFTYDKAANAWFLTEIDKGSFDADNAANNNNVKETPKQFGKINFVNFKGI